MHLETKNLTLALQSPDQVRAMIDALPLSERREVSPEWIARISESPHPNPWLHGFAIVHRASGASIGNAAFKGAPDAEGTVEIAYSVAPEHRGKGYATEAAAALTKFALGSGQVRVVRAHTRPEHNPSTTVLTKCGFLRIGPVVDPEDGLVWRWEKQNLPAGGTLPNAEA